MKKILQLFLNSQGEASSKRFAGIALIAAGIVGAFTGMDSTNVGILIGAGTGIFTVQAVTKT